MTFFPAGDCETGQGDGRQRSEGGGHRGGERGGPDLPSYSPGFFYIFYLKKTKKAGTEAIAKT